MALIYDFRSAVVTSPPPPNVAQARIVHLVVAIPTAVDYADGISLAATDLLAATGLSGVLEVLTVRMTDANDATSIPTNWTYDKPHDLLAFTQPTSRTVDQANIAAGVGNAELAVETVLATLSLSAGRLATSGQSVHVRAWGSVANNADTDKAVALRFGGLAGFLCGALTFTASKALGWALDATITSTGDAHQHTNCTIISSEAAGTTPQQSITDSAAGTVDATVAQDIVITGTGTTVDGVKCFGATADLFVGAAETAADTSIPSVAGLDFPIPCVVHLVLLGI